MSAKSLDKRINLTDFLSSMRDRFQQILASTLTDEEKLDRILAAMENDVLKKRILARKIGAQMRALKDPETAQMESLEALETRRETLVRLGGKILSEKEFAEKAGKTHEAIKLQAQLVQVSDEVKGLDEGLLGSQRATYEMLSESYAIAFENLKQSEAAWKAARDSAPAMLKAIEAHRQALEMRDEARTVSQKKADTRFLKDLKVELGAARAELRSDKAIEADLDATKEPDVNDLLVQYDMVAKVDSAIMAEFSAAARK